MRVYNWHDPGPGAALAAQSGDAARLYLPSPRHGATLQQHCAAVTKSMSNCVRLQLYSSERLSLSGLLCETTRRRAHPGTHTDAAARTQRHTRMHARTRGRAGLTANTDKVSDIAACTGKGKVKTRLPWALCRGVSHHHTFSYLSEFTKIVSKAVCEQRENMSGYLTETCGHAVCHCISEEGGGNNTPRCA